MTQPFYLENTKPMCAKPLLVGLALVLMLGGCSATVQPGRTRVDTGGVIITTDPLPEGKFCPPGQAKKGRC